MAEPTNTPMPGSTPVPASTPRSTSPVPPAPSLTPNATKRPIVLHIGDPIKYNPETYAEFSNEFDVIRTDTAERERGEFIRALKEHRWGDFNAIFRPFWGIIYCNSGLAAAEAVADFTVIMILSTFRHLPWCMSAATLTPSPSTKPSNPSTFAREAFQTCHIRAPLVSHNPRGRVLGLIGLGNIGQQIAVKLGNPAFGMRIAYYDVFRKPTDLESSLGAVFYPTLESLLCSSDCVVLCTPASPDGKPLITASTLNCFRPGTRFVNVARGSLVDEEALADALDAGVVGAAALDVHEDEPRRCLGDAS
ncbi:hypothetical protein N0V88_002101 [Collariella sp. IMI 366227]|nr:hypothetical protein N0V88_002101 [Collariella sp. IMI 366227]